MKTLENIQDLKKLLLNPYTIYTYDYAGGFIINDIHRDLRNRDRRRTL